MSVAGLGRGLLSDPAMEDLPGFDRLASDGLAAEYLLPEFPTTPLPNLLSLVTGLLPRQHGLVGDFIFQRTTSNLFHALTQPSDLHRHWWPNSRFSHFSTTHSFFGRDLDSHSSHQTGESMRIYRSNCPTTLLPSLKLPSLPPPELGTP